MAVGSHWPPVANIAQKGPYFDPAHVVHAGCRDDDEHLAEVRARLGLVRTASQVRADGIEATADQMRRALTGVEGCWLHVDVDILDPAVLPAVDSPVAGGA
jgi:arginase